MLSRPPAGTPAMYYVRTASIPQWPPYIDRQEAACCELIARHGLSNLGGRSDLMKSGRTMQGRPGLLELIQLAQHGHYQVLVVETMDRLSRNASEAHALRDQLGRMGVTILTVETRVTESTDGNVGGLDADEVYAITVAYAAGVTLGPDRAAFERQARSRARAGSCL